MSSRSLQLIGWILFVLSAVAFIVSGWRAGDPASLLGGLLFLAGCLVLMAPLLRK
jgi:hypothetical protein